jgi:hypothetical protein
MTHLKAMGAWVAYVWATTVAGLAIHPYQSVKRMVMGDKVLLPTTLSPVLGLVGLFVAAFLLFLPWNGGAGGTGARLYINWSFAVASPTPGFDCAVLASSLSLE